MPGGPLLMISWAPLLRKAICLRDMNPCENYAALAILTHPIPHAAHAAHPGLSEIPRLPATFESALRLVVSLRWVLRGHGGPGEVALSVGRERSNIPLL